MEEKKSNTKKFLFAGAVVVSAIAAVVIYKYLSAPKSTTKQKEKVKIVINKLQLKIEKRKNKLNKHLILWMFTLQL